ncbi:vegetative cell wall protein gp1-like [Coregonus clupeaformis]|uniref:vegetative cell wall protein gp1-like n=1 Tax=Coregonus clupeaformis TaxID=59861 RepID=UPI001E1C7FC6|nr:vegetative cell wall protein gp1-like [Coregonus clupeaformis]
MQQPAQPYQSPAHPYHSPAQPSPTKPTLRNWPSPTRLPATPSSRLPATPGQPATLSPSLPATLCKTPPAITKPPAMLAPSCHQKCDPPARSVTPPVLSAPCPQSTPPLMTSVSFSPNTPSSAAFNPPKLPQAAHPAPTLPPVASVPPRVPPLATTYTPRCGGNWLICPLWHITVCSPPLPQEMHAHLRGGCKKLFPLPFNPGGEPPTYWSPHNSFNVNNQIMST